MTPQAAAVLAWAAEIAPMVTTIGGGSLALVSAFMLFLIATALGPDVHVFPCIDQRARFCAYLTAFTWFIRAVLILTNITGPDARHAHWDMPVSWGMTAILLGSILAYVWSQRMPPEVRARFDRRERFKRKRVQTLVAMGDAPAAAEAADGHDIAPLVYAMGGTAELVEAIDRAP